LLLAPLCYFRFVELGEGIAFDPAPYVPTLISQSKHYGHYIVIGEDATATKYLGFNDNYTLAPDLADIVLVSTHSLESDDSHGYIDHLKAVYDNSVFPVPTEGFANGVTCEIDYDELCASGACKSEKCADGVSDPPCGLFGWEILCFFQPGCGWLDEFLGFCGCGFIQSFLGLCGCNGGGT